MKRAGATFRLQSNTRAVTAGATHALERALNRVAIHWHGEARQLVPVDTGRLRSSIAFSAPGTNPAVMLEGAQGGIFQPPATQGLEAMVGTNVEYGPAVHELHPDPNKRGFIENPGNENAERYQGIIREEVMRATSSAAAADD